MGEKLKNLILIFLIIIVSVGIIFLIINATRSLAYNKNVQNPIVTLSIEGYGDVQIELYPDYAPNTVSHIVNLVQKGFFDTIPQSIYEAAKIDGATNARIFATITLPLAKPIIVYTALTSFAWPWSDFILPKLLLIDKNNWTVAVGLMQLQQNEFSRFAAGSVFIAVPIELEDVINCPINTVVVIPKCKGHRHGHIFTVVEKGVYCSDGKEVAGNYFDNNYKTAKGIYAFIPTDGSIKLTPELLQQSPELYATILQKQTGKDVRPLINGNDAQPILFAELSSQKNSHTQ